MILCIVLNNGLDNESSSDSESDDEGSTYQPNSDRAGHATDKQATEAENTDTLEINTAVICRLYEAYNLEQRTSNGESISCHLHSQSC